MRRRTFAGDSSPLFLALLGMSCAFLFSSPALADTATSSITWSSLQPGDDWTVQVIDSLFPISGSAKTATGSVLQALDEYAALIAMFWIGYASMLQVHRTAESGKIFSASFSGMAPVRAIVAVIMMTPATNGYAIGQVMLVDLAKLSIGAARFVENKVVDSIGPSAFPLAEPMIPGTRQVVMGVMESELCRALVNLASNNANLVPAPKVPTNSSNPVISVAYSLASGNGGAAPACGSIEIGVALQNALPSSSGEDARIDLSSLYAAHLQAISQLVQVVRPAMQQVATTLWTTRNSSALEAMDATLTSASASYTANVTSAATAAVAKVRATLAGQQGSGEDPGVTAMQSLGWSGLGAFYLEIARANSDVMAITSVTPAVTAPTYEGLGSGLTSDLARIIPTVRAYQTREGWALARSDTSTAPNSTPSLYANNQIATTPTGLLNQVLQYLGINNFVLAGLLNHLVSPTSGSDWQDPFAALIALGHSLIFISMGIIGGVALLSSKVGTASTMASVLGNVATGNLVGAAASATMFALSGTITSLATPIIAGAALLMAPGITLAYMLPMAPYAYWIIGVAGWLVLVVEAVICLPFWAIAHLVFEGEGLHGRGKRGYEVLLTIMFRPVMMIAGLMVSYTIFAAVSWLLMKSFTVATGFLFDQGYLLDNLIGVVLMLCMFVSMEMSLAVMSFRLISTLPHHLVEWVGMATVGRTNSDGFVDGTTGRGMHDPRTKAADLAIDAVGALGNGKVLDKPSGTKVDSTTRALLNPPGPGKH
ncbi:DotA/TraY family protein [Gluconacetobacter diazotrophicus]|uniref:DotA/TraY family protein n=1 Tax=Gluconacetobacter diazotrophicus TaxID=33996 RepID=A0A7W4FF65_GLUDI|nr:DotA/TraY family protein [Gluconacetobacter diazotrophicus]MBB2156641.1 DotA/TraY family protein [Gluconacetobacter diazotrophicus]